MVQRRAACCSFVARARLVPACRRAALPDAAATVARLHHGLTGAPLFTDVADQVREGDAARCAHGGLHPAAASPRDDGGAAASPGSDALGGRDATVPPIALDATHIAIWLRDAAG